VEVEHRVGGDELARARCGDRRVAARTSGRGGWGQTSPEVQRGALNAVRQLVAVDGAAEEPELHGVAACGEAGVGGGEDAAGDGADLLFC